MGDIKEEEHNVVTKYSNRVWFLIPRNGTTRAIAHRLGMITHIKYLTGWHLKLYSQEP